MSQKYTGGSGSGPQIPSYMYKTGNAGKASGAVPAQRANGQGASNSRSNSASGSAKRTGASGSVKRTSASGGGKKKRSIRLQRLLKLALCVLGGLLVVVTVLLLVTRKPQEQTAAEYEQKGTTFKGEVTVNGVDVNGMTIEQARTAVGKALNEELASINLSIKESTGSFSLSAADMDITTNLEDVLAEAMYYSSTGGTDEGEMRPEGSTGKDFDVTLTPTKSALLSRLDDLVLDVNVAPIEPYAVASLSEENIPQFEYFEGTDGRMLDEQASADAIIAMIQSGNYEAAAELVYTPVPPETTLDYIKENTQFRAKYTTRYKKSGSDQVVINRCFNVEKGSTLLNGCIMMPEEEFSFNGYVGLRTEEAGWKLANGISGGKEYTLQAGGGICQVSTTLYNALLCGNVAVTERRAHSIPSDYVPKGLDATVDSRGIDLKFINDTGAPLYIFSYITKDPDSSRYLNITVELYGVPLPEGVTYQTRSEITEEIPRDEGTVYTASDMIPAGYQVTTVIKHDGYVAEAYVDKYKDGELVDTRPLGTSKYGGNPAEIEVGFGDPATVPIPDGAVPYTGGMLPTAESAA